MTWEWTDGADPPDEEFLYVLVRPCTSFKGDPLRGPPGDSCRRACGCSDRSRRRAGRPPQPQRGASDQRGARPTPPKHAPSHCHTSELGREGRSFGSSPWNDRLAGAGATPATLPGRPEGARPSPTRRLRGSGIRRFCRATPLSFFSQRAPPDGAQTRPPPLRASRNYAYSETCHLCHEVWP
ncbi:MAG: hypothetical protein JWN52_1976 [Actinomycetia bacterium]|nr:hypothetical protein [Actinomycetes bacterium]